jgi:hypothetical protein
MEAFSLAYGQTNVFGRFEPRASQGLCFFTFPNDAIYLPPGTIHTVYTIASGCLTGTTWASDTGLLASAQIFEQDFRKGESTTASFTNLIQSLWCAVHKRENSRDIEHALETICTTDINMVWRGKLWKPGILNELRSTIHKVRQELKRHGLEELVCPRCHTGILSHVEGDPPTQKRTPRAKGTMNVPPGADPVS